MYVCLDRRLFVCLFSPRSRKGFLPRPTPGFLPRPTPFGATINQTGRVRAFARLVGVHEGVPGGSGTPINVP